jgi:peroxiredoxin
MTIAMRIYFFVLFCFSGLLCQAQQNAYNIQFKVEGWKDTTVYLGHYYSESTYLRDTTHVNSKGEFTFDGKKPLERGVYFLVLNKVKIFEFVVGQTKSFKLETTATDFVKNMKVTGDIDNQIFFDNWRYSVNRQSEAEPFTKILKDSTVTDDKRKEAREQVNKIREKLLEYQRTIIAKHPTTTSAILFNSTQDVQVPDPPKLPNGKIDSTFQLRWYRAHFFDHFNLADDALIRMPQPVYSEKLNEYLDKLYIPQADTLIKAIDKLVAVAKKNQETYKYIIFTLMRKFQEPEIMGLDAVYVDLYDKYVATGQMDFWMNASHKKNVKEYAERLRTSLIGKTGANLIMLDENLQTRSLHALKNKYTILYIYDPDCGHCKKETPKLVSFYEKNKARLNLEVFAVCSDSSMVKMKKYIKEMNMNWVNVNGPRTFTKPYNDLYDAVTTPAMFILDDKKKIIGKKFPCDNLDNFFNNYEKILQSRTITKPSGAGQ